MDIQAMLVTGGVIVLVVALTIKALVTRTPFQRVTVAFTILWASFFACHFWQSSLSLLELVLRTDSHEIRVLGGFWLAFVLGCLPGVFMIQAWMRNWDPDLPAWFDRTAGILAAVLVGVLLLLHLLMSAEIAVPQVRDYLAAGSTPAKVLKTASRFTLRTYSRLGARICHLTTLTLAQERVPVEVLESLREKPARPRRNAPSP